MLRLAPLNGPWREICSRAGIPPEPLAKLNPSLRVAKEEVTQAVLLVVRRAYARDFELFGYTPP
jgi:hypothetical protein